MADKKGTRKNRRVVKMNELYEQTKPKNKSCPKCGPGVFMANHGSRSSCGKCGFTEFSSKKTDILEEKATEPEKVEKASVEKKAEEKPVEKTPEPQEKPVEKEE